MPPATRGRAKAETDTPANGAAESSEAAADAVKKADEVAVWTPQGAHAKLAWIQTHVTDVEKTGVNTHHGYNYMQEHGLLNVLRPLLREMRCSIVASPGESYVRDGNRVTIEGTLTFTDSEAPLLIDEAPNPDRQIHARFINEGVDSQDKATNKALTGWMKYALQKFFAVPTEDIDDADNAEVRAAQPAAPPAPAKADPDVVQLLIETAGQAVEAGTLDPNRFKAKVATYRTDKIAELSAEQLAELVAWTEDEIAKGTASPA